MIGRLLDLDMSTLGGMLAQACRWWLGELQSMVPEHWRRLNGGPAPTILLPTENGFRTADGSTVRVGVVLCLPHRAGLIRAVRLPPLSSKDLRRLVALDLERLSPFQAQQVLFDLQPARQPDGHQSVLVGIVPRAEAQDVLERARAQGFSPAAMALDDGNGRPCFDFLPELDRESTKRRSLTPARLWMTAAAFAVLNLLVFTVRDALELSALRQQVDDMQPAIRAAEKMRSMVEAESSRRADLIRRKESQSPLPVLDSLTRSLPDTVWVQKLEWDGAKLHILGWSRGGADPLALVEADPLLANAQPSPPAAMESAEQGAAFDITAERQRGDRR